MTPLNPQASGPPHSLGMPLQVSVKDQDPAEFDSYPLPLCDLEKISACLWTLSPVNQDSTLHLAGKEETVMTDTRLQFQALLEVTPPSLQNRTQPQSTGLAWPHSPQALL